MFAATAANKQYVHFKCLVLCYAIMFNGGDAVVTP